MTALDHPRFVVCRVCKYHMRPDQTLHGECRNVPICNGRVLRRLRDRDAARRKP